MWYSNVTYPSIYATYLNITYPILMGFNMNNEGYFLIENAGQLIYMSQLIDKYQVFREGKYLLVNSVDLKTVKPNSFVFTQSVFKGIFKGGEKADDGHEVLKKDGTKSNKNSIINLSVEYGNSYLILYLSSVSFLQRRLISLSTVIFNSSVLPFITLIS